MNKKSPVRKTLVTWKVMLKVNWSTKPTKHHSHSLTEITLSGESLHIHTVSFKSCFFICGECLMLILIRQRGEATAAAAAAEVRKTQCSACSRQLPSHSQSRALIYNLTWIEFILLRVADQGRAGWRERELPTSFLIQGHSLWSLFLFSPVFFCFISLTHRHNVPHSYSVWHSVHWQRDAKH